MLILENEQKEWEMIHGRSPCALCRITTFLSSQMHSLPIWATPQGLWKTVRGLDGLQSTHRPPPSAHIPILLIRQLSKNILSPDRLPSNTHTLSGDPVLYYSHLRWGGRTIFLGPIIKVDSEGIRLGETSEQE